MRVGCELSYITERFHPVTLHDLRCIIEHPFTEAGTRVFSRIMLIANLGVSSQIPTVAEPSLLGQSVPTVTEVRPSLHILNDEIAYHALAAMRHPLASCNPPRTSQFQPS